MRSPFLIAALVCAVCACGTQKLEHTLPPNVHEDTYAQTSASAVDVLWVIDNSGSMAPRQQNLARNFSSFMDIFTRGSIDYRLAVTTTDVFVQQGNFVGSPAIISPQTPDPIDTFGANVQVGDNGSSYSPGFEPAQLAISRQTQLNAQLTQEILQCQNGCNSGDTTCQSNCSSQFPVQFLRPGAYLYIVVVTDQDDHSPEDVYYYYRYFEDAQGIGNDATVLFSAITGLSNTNSCNATLGASYIQMASLTNGEYGDICDAEFADTLQRLSTNAVGLRRKFALSEQPNVQTLSVSLTYPCNEPTSVLNNCASTDNSQCTGQSDTFQGLVCTPIQGGPDGWSYESDTNVIFFAGESVPDLNAQISIEYYLQGTGPT
jgi:hypothetical protein